MSELRIDDLRATVDGKEILNGVTLTVRSGEVHAVMGPNGSGKSTLSNVLMGKPGYEVTGGSVTLDGADLLAMSTWERAQAGLYLAMQYPTEVPGVRLSEVLEESYAAAGRDRTLVGPRLFEEADRIGFDRAFLDRPLNVDLSGGEKKRNETVQLAVLSPRIAILDEIDSGLDVDALRAVSRRIESATTDGIFPDGAAGRAPRRPGHHALQPAARGAPPRCRAHLRQGSDPRVRRSRAGDRPRGERLRRLGAGCRRFGRGGRRQRAVASPGSPIPSPTRCSEPAALSRLLWPRRLIRVSRRASGTPRAPGGCRSPSVRT